MLKLLLYDSLCRRHSFNDSTSHAVGNCSLRLQNMEHGQDAPLARMGVLLYACYHEGLLHNR